ncbi:MAG: DUF481 domain-containing protein [Gammaproteobacteria bacterium]|nr:DUF481 domain-containing protein [Gammaproteobacteria bacterium]
MRFIFFISLFLFVFSSSALSNNYYQTRGYKLDPLITNKPFDININAELGALVTTGNNESTSILSKITVEHDIQQWKLKYSFGSLFKENQKVDSETGKKVTETTSEKYSVNGEAKFEMDQRRSLFSYASGDFDRFGSYKTYFSWVAGYSFRAIDGSLIVWDIDIAPGFTHVEPKDEESESAPMLRSSSNFEWTVSSHAKLNQKFSIETSSINTRMIFDTSLTAKIHGSALMKVSYKAIHDDSVAVNKEKTNTQTSVTLVINF